MSWKCSFLGFFLLTLGFERLLSADTYPPDHSTVIPLDRRSDWTLAGIPGGIPMRTTIFADVTKPPYDADNTGVNDASGAINKALADCRPDEVVYLPPGKYRLTGQVNFLNRSDRTLRGAGAATVLFAEFRAMSAINIGVNEHFRPAAWAAVRTASSSAPSGDWK